MFGHRHWGRGIQLRAWGSGVAKTMGLKETNQRQRTRGATALGYALIIGLLSVAAIGSVSRLGDATDSLFGDVSDSLANAVDAIPCDGGQAPSLDDGDCRPVAPAQSVAGYDVPSLVDGEEVTLTRVASVTNGSETFQARFRGVNGSVVMVGSETSQGISCNGGYETYDGACAVACPSGFARVTATTCSASGFGCGACPSGAEGACGIYGSWTAGTASRCRVPLGWSQQAASYSSYNGINYGNNSGSNQALCYHHGSTPSCGNRGNIQPPNPNASYTWSLTITAN